MSVTEVFYDLSQALLHPVLWCIYISFIYAIYELGRFGAKKVMRRKYVENFQGIKNGKALENLAGYPIIAFAFLDAKASLNDIEVYAFKRLEVVKMVTRITPMLGLIATLIPMGPALMALTENNVVSMSEHLRTAFTAVILALSAASLTFWVATVKKRWYAEEMAAVEKQFIDK